ncbi:2,3-diaminopropionate biosynthesis protein SbnB [Actinophytocola sp.]|uniref:2,3-diaminopropionate biosynthesis protein SbnB n=1 Tax=Actinophytocola sp. TaxID=1872138 RepID=UPI002D36D342|nr:2,3-diaminopropionate biosynthesis protein SbnB [Actinophytocola sp.]HYQ66191.1 2,3-diaminopropionate biosynthesis protein SbnB [Actinophytocola sp.]
MLILGNEPVRSVLDGREEAVVELVRRCYLTHARGDTSLPHSVFLRFADQPRDRIIALPARVGGEQRIAGVKWIASFPGNVSAGVARASATIILNSMDTGQPLAVVEGSTISARRTAASAALAAATLGSANGRGVALIGCGVINFEVLRFLRTTNPGLTEVTLFDLSQERARSFAARCAREPGGPAATVADRLEDALGAHTLISFATTAGVPHTGLAHCLPGSLVLHLSLRDIQPEALLDKDNVVNVVDDADHVCREATSVDLAARLAGHRDFIQAALGDVLAGSSPYDRDPRRVTVFSPFGLGILDIALADFVRVEAVARGVGTHLTDFLPPA